jgi:drug/metabolite transporter (DMT)-like permease
MHLGLAVGVLSAFLVAIFGSLNKRYVEQGSPLLVTGVELAAGTAFLTIVAVAMWAAVWWIERGRSREHEAAVVAHADAAPGAEVVR